MILPKFKEGDLISASDWNIIASEVNRIWGSEGANGIRLTKGEPWRISKTSQTAPPVCQAGGLNGPAYKVYVWRNDKWDWGSTSSPLAFFVGGAFTQWGSQSAVRLAKFIPTVDCELNTIGVHSEFQEQNQFGAPIYYIGTTKGATPWLMVGSLTGNQRNSTGGLNVAWLIDYEAGTLKPGWTPIAGADIGPGFFGTLNSLVATDSDLYACRFTKIIKSTIADGTQTATGVGVNIHNMAAASSKFFLSARHIIGEPTETPNIYGTEPRALAYLDSSYAVDTTFDTNAGVGSGADCFTLALVGKQSWQNEFENDKICWAVMSLEFTGVQYNWNGAANYAGNAFSSAIVPILENGGLHPAVALGSHLCLTSGGRASVFCDYDGSVWFGGSMTSVESFGTGSIAVTASNTVVRYDRNTNEIECYEFNGPVYDCQHFDGGQMIVVGDFTEYVGVVGGSPVNEPCSYMAFIDQSGTFLPQLTWP